MNESKVLYNYFKQQLQNNPNVIMTEEKTYPEYDIEIFSYVEIVNNISCMDSAIEKINDKLEQKNNILESLGVEL